MRAEMLRQTLRTVKPQLDEGGEGKKKRNLNAKSERDADGRCLRGGFEGLCGTPPDGRGKLVLIPVGGAYHVL